MNQIFVAYNDPKYLITFWEYDKYKITEGAYKLIHIIPRKCIINKTFSDVLGTKVYIVKTYHKDILSPTVHMGVRKDLSFMTAYFSNFKETNNNIVKFLFTELL